jgi:hypothetical protein
LADELVTLANPAPGATTVGAMTQERPSSTIVAALTVDPSTGTTFTFTSTAVFTTAFGTGQFRVKVENEVCLATVASATTLTVTRGQDGTTNVAHAIGKIVAALGIVQYVIPMSNRSVSYCGCAATWRTLGSGASPQILFSIENQAASPVIVGVAKLSVEMEMTVAITSLAADLETYRPTSIATAGVPLTKGTVDTAMTSSTSVVLRGMATGHGTNSTAITAPAPATSPMWHQFAQRLASTASTTVPEDFNMLPADIAEVDWVNVRPGESLAVRVVGTATNNPATNHYVVKCAWFEYSIP